MKVCACLIVALSFMSGTTLHAQSGNRQPPTGALYFAIRDAAVATDLSRQSATTRIAQQLSPGTKILIAGAGGFGFGFGLVYFGTNVEDKPKMAAAAGLTLGALAAAIAYKLVQQ